MLWWSVRSRLSAAMNPTLSFCFPKRRAQPRSIMASRSHHLFCRNVPLPFVRPPRLRELKIDLHMRQCPISASTSAGDAVGPPTTDHVDPFQASINGVKTPLTADSPTAVHAVAVVHDTPLSVL